MIGPNLALATLLVAQNFAVRAEITTRAQAGTTPVQPGTDPLASAQIEALPSLALNMSDGGYQLELTYAPRIFYRAFFQDPGFETLDRPLISHSITAGYSQRLSQTWNLSMNVGVEFGQVDFQEAVGAVDLGTDEGAVPTGDPVAQTGAAQSISSLATRGSIILSGQLSRRLAWSNEVSAGYTEPLGDIEQEGNAALVGLLPQAFDIGYATTLAYVLARNHSMTGAASFTANFIEAVGVGGDPAMMTEAQDQQVQSVSLTIGYGYAFGRSSSLAVSAGGQVAVGQGAGVGEFGGGEQGGDGSFGPTVLPTATLTLNWVPINQRSVTVANDLSVLVEGSVDAFGRFQPRLTGSTGFQIGLPPKMTIGLIGSVNIPLARPENGDGVGGVGAGDSIVDVSTPITYQFTPNFVGTIGAQISYFFNRFETQVQDPNQPTIDDSPTIQGFIELTYGISSRRGQQARGALTP